MPEPQVLNQLAVPLDVRPLEVLQQASTLADHLEQAAATVVVLGVFAEMVSQVVDACGQQRDLNGCTASVLFVELVPADYFVLIECHDGCLLESLVLVGKRRFSDLSQAINTSDVV